MDRFPPGPFAHHITHAQSALWWFSCTHNFTHAAEKFLSCCGIKMNVNYPSVTWEMTMTQKHLQLLSTPSRSHWDDFIVNLGCGGLVLGNRTCLPKSSLWIDNWSHRHKEYLNQHLYHCLWGLAEHGGHLVMMIIKKLLLPTKALTTEMWLTGQYSPEWGQGEDRRSHTGPRCCQLPWQSYGLFDKKYKKYVFASLPYISGICTYTNRGCG